MIRRRASLALLALLVPLPALALPGGGEPAGPTPIAISASLSGCGLVKQTIVCEINASWDAVEGADYYSVSVSGPSGSVSDHGQTGGLGATLAVPYAGSGAYAVRVAAWGTRPGQTEPELLTEGTSSEEPASGGALGADQYNSAGPKDDEGDAGEANAEGESEEADDLLAAGPNGSAQSVEPADQPMQSSPPPCAELPAAIPDEPAAPAVDSTELEADTAEAGATVCQTAPEG